MPQSPTSPNNTEKQDSRRAARLRDNKRRNRQRQKDYTASLETTLRDLQKQGVQATQEVQLSARKVVEDNTRLKALLRHVGVDDQVIETWRPDNAEKTLPALPACEKKAGNCVVKDHIVSGSPPNLHPKETVSQFEPAVSSEKLYPIECSTQKVNTLDLSENIVKDKPMTLTLPPCKVLTRLAQDPSADITQPIAKDDDTDEQENGGVECSKAHAMLMQFATNEEKLDVVSQALERGCVGKKGGGCKVRNEVVWKAMDEVIN